MSETARSSAADEQEINKRPELSVVPTTGSVLQAARLQAGLSIEQVSEQLKWSLRQVNALESNQFDQLPAMVIVRGFVRSYAKLLKIDADAVLASLPSDTQSANPVRELRPTLSTPFQESKTSFLGRTENTNRKYIVGAVILAFAALAVVAVQQLEQKAWVKNLLSQWQTPKAEEPHAASTSQAVDEIVAPLALPTEAPKVPVAKESVASQAEVQTPSVNAIASNTSKAEEAKAAEVPPASVSANSEVSSVTAQTVTASDVLKLKFKEDSWVQVKRENGPVLTARVIKAGSEESFEVKEGLQVKIGNGNGVEAWLRGEAVPVQAGKDSKVVNLTIK